MRRPRAEEKRILPRSGGAGHAQTSLRSLRKANCYAGGNKTPRQELADGLCAFNVVREERSKPLSGIRFLRSLRCCDCKLLRPGGREACNFVFAIPLNRRT
jgi:hypothetical protein